MGIGGWEQLLMKERALGAGGHPLFGQEAAASSAAPVVAVLGAQQL